MNRYYAGLMLALRRIFNKPSTTKKELIDSEALETPYVPSTFGATVSDKVAKWAGSWQFIIGFLSLMLLWVSLNVVGLMRHWDVYPFILLNLILSTLAALQAPIIMMSQNRQEARDREIDLRYSRSSAGALNEINDKLDKLLE